MSRLLATLLAAALTTPALAQSAPTPPAPANPTATPLGGPVIAGVCLISVDAVIAASKAGQAASVRLTDLAKAADQDLALNAPLSKAKATL